MTFLRLIIILLLVGFVPKLGFAFDDGRQPLMKTNCLPCSYNPCDCEQMDEWKYKRRKDGPIAEIGGSLYKLGNNLSNDKGLTLSYGRSDIDENENAPRSIFAFEYHSHSWNNVNFRTGVGKLELDNFTFSYTKWKCGSFTPTLGFALMRAKAHNPLGKIDSSNTIAPYIGISAFRIFEIRRYLPQKEIDGLSLKGTMITLRYVHFF